VRLRLLSYNIRYGGTGREAALAEVVAAANADLVVLQEATRPDVVERVAGAAGFATWMARPGHSLAFLSRVPVSDHRWVHPEWSSRAFLEIVLEEPRTTVFGVHLSAVHSNWTERRRVREIQAVLDGIKAHRGDAGTPAPGAEPVHVVTGDFNTLAPGEDLRIDKLPWRLRPLVWLGGRRIRWQTVQLMLDAKYADAYRALHPEDPGHTFPTWDPHVRLDYAFVPFGLAGRVTACEVVTPDGALAAASDHFPLRTELELPG
jgi:exodeoxyribonuclease-3